MTITGSGAPSSTARCNWPTSSLAFLRAVLPRQHAAPDEPFADQRRRPIGRQAPRVYVRVNRALARVGVLPLRPSRK